MSENPTYGLKMLVRQKSDETNFGDNSHFEISVKVLLALVTPRFLVLYLHSINIQNVLLFLKK